MSSHRFSILLINGNCGYRLQRLALGAQSPAPKTYFSKLNLKFRFSILIKVLEPASMDGSLGLPDPLRRSRLFNTADRRSWRPMLLNDFFPSWSSRIKTPGGAPREMKDLGLSGNSHSGGCARPLGQQLSPRPSGLRIQDQAPHGYNPDHVLYDGLPQMVAAHPQEVVEILRPMIVTDPDG
jgi:hypothetical protein